MSRSLNNKDALARDAWWYAIGRKDAGENVDPDGFKEQYRMLVAEFDAGDVFFRPSIQDAYNEYLKGSN
jgi:hypothetical protein